MHSYCHNLSCRTKFSPTFKFGIGLEDGENAERWWSRMNWNSNLSFMRPENRRDFISTLVDGKNESALEELPRTLRLKLKKAKKILESSGLQRDFVVVNNNLNSEISQYRLMKFSGKVRQDIFLEKIFDTCATIKKLRINQFGKNGAKKTAMYSNAIKSSVKDLAELIKIYNSEFKCNLTDNDVFSQCSSDRLESGLATEIRYWKACEQVLMTIAHICAAIKRLESLVSNLIVKITDPDCEKYKDLFAQRKEFYSNILGELRLLQNFASDLANSHKNSLEQLKSFK